MQAPCTILYIITSTNAGGSERALTELLRRIDRSRYRPFVCSLKKPGAFAPDIAAAAEGFFSLGLSEAGGLRAIASFLPALVRLVILLKRIKPLIIHGYLFRANIIGRIAARIAGVPVVISSIRVIEPEKQFKHFIDRLTASLVHMYIAVSEAARRFTIERVRVAPDRIVTVRNGIDCSSERSGRAPPLAVDEECINLALIGRFERQKGHAVFISALQEVVRRFPDVRAYFCGEGPGEQRIRQLVQRSGLSGHVVFAGVVRDIAAFMAHMDLIVLPSLWEGMPNVLLEAMAQARPVVASRVAGIDEVVADGKTGLLVEPGDAGSLAAGIIRVVACRQDALQMGQRGRQRVHEAFTIEETVRSTVTLYGRLLRKKGFAAGCGS